jgi:tetrathionate reductase subunit B
MKEFTRRELAGEMVRSALQIGGPPVLILLAGPHAVKRLQGPVQRLLDSLFSREEPCAPVPPPVPYDASQHAYGFVVKTGVCIGCGRCVNACKVENQIPLQDTNTRTWVERYSITEEREVLVDSPRGGVAGFPPREGEGTEVRDAAMGRSFFVPKLCNQCVHPPCVQVCPVGATYATPDGVVLVDRSRCVGCGYCVQVCPYGARFLHPRLGVADKCTWCYHRITRGMLPACVSACPRGARLFGDLHDPGSPVRDFLRNRDIYVLKEELGTKPKVFYEGYRMGVI